MKKTMFTNKRQMSRLITSTLMASLMWGCSSSLKDYEPIPLSANPTKELNRLHRNVLASKNKKVALLSPSWFKKAANSLAEGRQAYNDGEKVRDIFAHLARGQAELRKANEYTSIAKASLKETLLKRKQAISVGATLDTKGFLKAEEKMAELVLAIENSDLEKANNNKHDVWNVYSEIELNLIIQQSMTTAAAAYKKAKENNVESYAPIAFNQATMKINRATNFIRENRYDKAGISFNSSEALFYTNRAINIAVFGKFIQDNTSESIALWIEKQTSVLANTLGVDFRDRSLAKQFAALQNEISAVQAGKEALMQEERTLKRKITELMKTSINEEKKIAQLKIEKEFNKRFGRVRKMFRKNEAEVYKEGSKLVIRLKGVRFPTGKAVLLSKNYKLLAKVRSALKSFSGSRVRIEGHTDSVGSEEANNWLSNKRAISVREYLLAHSSIESDKLEAVGLGFYRPIATNKTRRGRSQNRRIDIIIDPEKQFVE